MNELIEFIGKSAAMLQAHSAFTDWLASQSPNAGDYVLVNNSFVYRDVRTAKSEKYLAFRMGNSDVLDPHPLVVTGVRINSDFKHVAAQSGNLRAVALEEAVAQELAQLGPLILVLIGHVEDTVILEQPLGHGALASVIWDPTLEEAMRIEGPNLLVQDTYDEEIIWNGVVAHFAERGVPVPSGLREAVGVALDALQDQAVAHLCLPTNRGDVGQGMTDAIVTVLREQRAQYAAALEQSQARPDVASDSLNEVLRIAYNFASDATAFLKLVVSICDLRPIVLWATIAEHHSLSEAFRALPWVRSRNKPSLKNYISTIADARNSAFHDLFPFRKSLSISLPQSALREARLCIFSEHGRRKQNQLTYQDKELVDILLEFTRARERRAPDRFWRQNLAVMDATIDLFSRTNEFVKALHPTLCLQHAVPQV